MNLLVIRDNFLTRLILASIVCLLAVQLCDVKPALASQINLNVIKQIESSGNPLAYNKSSKAKGLYQITPICLEEYNNYHEKQVAPHELFVPSINEKVAKWYLNVRIPQMLRYFKKPLTTDNILISYNAGINYVVKGKRIPLETKNYINKYKKMVK